MIFASDSTRTRQIPDFAGKTWNHLKITRTKAEIQFVLWEIWCSCIDGQCVGLLASNSRRSKSTRSLLQSVIEAWTTPGDWHTFGEAYLLTYKRTNKQTTTCLPIYIALHPLYYLTNFLPGTLWLHNSTTVYYTDYAKDFCHSSPETVFIFFQEDLSFCFLYISTGTMLLQRNVWQKRPKLVVQ